jgi:hypothetical protein
MQHITQLERRLILLIPPILLMVLEWWHPAGFSKHVFPTLYPERHWWLTLHLLQLPLFALVGTAIFVLLADIHHWSATVSRVAAWFFIVYYAAFDSVAGIGLGVIFRDIQGWTPEEQAPIIRLAQLYFNDPLFGGTHSWMSEFASLTWLVTALSATWALFRARRPLLPLLFLVLAGFFLWRSHAYPYGPLAFLCLFLAYLGLEFWPKKKIKQS